MTHRAWLHTQYLQRVPNHCQRKHLTSFVIFRIVSDLPIAYWRLIIDLVAYRNFCVQRLRCVCEIEKMLRFFVLLTNTKNHLRKSSSRFIVLLRALRSYFGRLLLRVFKANYRSSPKWVGIFRSVGKRELNWHAGPQDVLCPCCRSRLRHKWWSIL